MASSVIGALRVKLGLNSAQFEAGLKKADGAIAGFRGSMLKMAAGIGAAFGAALSVKAIGEASDQWSDLSSRVGNAVGSMDAAPEVMSRIQDMARASYSDLSQTAEAFVANSQALKDMGMTTAEQLDYTEALNNALVVSGAKGQHAAQVQDALSRAMATGKLSGLGLNTVLSRGGRVAEALADELGTTVSGLRTVGAQGKITGDVIARALTGRLQELRDEAEEMPATIGDGMTLIRNSMLALVGVMDQTTGASGSVANALVGIADAVTAVTKWISTNGEIITTVFSTIVGSVGVLATAFATKYAVGVGVTAVKAMVSAYQSSVALNVALGAQSVAAARAGVAIKALSGAFHFLKGAIISTGIGALVVGAGYLVGKFMQLVSAAGGFGNAMALLGEVAREAWDRIGWHFDALKMQINAGWKGIQASGFDMFAAIISGGVDFGNRYVGVYRGAFEAVKAIWGKLPAAIGDMAYQAAEALLRGVEWMLTKAAKPIDMFLSGINKVRGALGSEPLDLIGEVKLPPLENPYAGQAKEAGKAAADAFVEGFRTDTFDQPTGVLDGLGASADDLRGQAETYRAMAGVLSEAATRPMTAWQRLKEMVGGASAEAKQIPPVADAAGSALDGLGGKGSAAGQKAAAGMKKTKDAVDEVAKAADRGAQAIGGAFEGVLDRTKSLRQGIADLIMEIARMQMMKGFTSLFGGGGPLSGIGGSVGGLIGANANGTANWRGGLSRIHERGGEIVDLPSGSRVIPHDLSKRIVDEGQGGGFLRVMIEEAPGFAARVRTEAQGVAVQVVSGASRQQADRQYSRGMA